MNISFNASLKGLNTFGIECYAYALASFADRHELTALLSHSDLHGRPYMILGGGSNLLFTKDYDGVILLNKVKGITLESEDAEYFYVKAGAGENWHQFVQHCISHGWAGLENLSLIPGNVGASPMQNIGAYGVEIKDRFHSLEAYNINTGIIRDFDAVACEFGYRESVFKRKLKDRYVIINVTFSLFKNPDLNISYGAIGDELKVLGVEKPGIADVSQAVINIRNSKLPNPSVLGNAGSFFKNPVVDTSIYEAVAKQYPDAPHYPAPDGMVKMAAGWLIEKAGWKGRRLGACGVHEKQALVLVNYGGATGNEIYTLSQLVLDAVKSKFNIDLEREVNIV